MVAASGLKRLRETNTFSPQVQGHTVPDLLRCAAIFGPNAAGKSNLIKALRFVESMVMESAEAKPDHPINVQPFRLGPDNNDQDSTFEVDFVEDGTRFQFGFSANKERVTKEWLNSYVTARATELYHRHYDEELKRDVYRYGRALEGGRRLGQQWSAQTSAKTLYLSRVVQASSEEFQQLRTPYRWFSHRLRIEYEDHLPDLLAYSAMFWETVEGKKKVLEFLNAFDIPITDIEIKKRNVDLESSLFSEEFKGSFHGDKEITFRTPVFTHLSAGGHPVKFTGNDESDGTMNLFRFAAKWIAVLEENLILVVDELDSSLHPLAVWELIRRLGKSKSSAQLIFTTHDTTVLRSKLLRRDQTFFMSPNKRRESQLYSLHDFKGREEDAFEDRYLQGRYGATPLITS
jgi:uncharacterized protein